MVDLLIGKDKHADTSLIFPFDSENTPNNHCTILGRSGVGKSYAGLHLQYQAICNEVSVINFDFSGSYTEDRINPLFSNVMDGKITRINVHDEGIAINPFHLNQTMLSSKVYPTDISEKISEIISSSLNLGKSQKYSIYQAINNGLSGKLKLLNNNNPYLYELNKDEKGNIVMDMNALRYLLAEQKNATSDKVIENLSILLDKKIFRSNDNNTWNNLLYNNAKLTIIDLNQFTPSLQRIILELILYDLWDYIKINGNTTKPFITVFDEAQNLNHKVGSSVAKILNEGRKYGWSSWFIMQSTSQLKNDEVSRLGQTSLQLFFNPPQPDIYKISKLISPANPSKYIRLLDQLKKGECMLKGTIKNSNNVYFYNEVKKVIIPNISQLTKISSGQPVESPVIIADSGCIL